MDDENRLDSILPKEVVEKIAIAVASLRATAVAKTAATANLTLVPSLQAVMTARAIVTANLTVGKAAEVIKSLPSPAESKKLWESPLGLLVIQIIAQMIFMSYQEYRGDARQGSGDQAMKKLVEIVSNIEEMLRPQIEKSQGGKTGQYTKESSAKRQQDRRSKKRNGEKKRKKS